MLRRWLWVVEVIWVYPKARGVGAIPVLEVHETRRGARRAVEIAKRQGARWYKFERATIRKYRKS